jgi:predicted house-cleaning noncanonical NTP pyrophosphatase (MazG superfamily)
MARGRDTVGKLVRDKIPDVIRQSGRTPRVTRLPADAYRSALMHKLHEEVAELTAAQTTESMLEEAGDVLEVLAAIATEHGATIDTIVEAAGKKRAERGGFTKRLWLDSVDADPRVPKDSSLDPHRTACP